MGKQSAIHTQSVAHCLWTVHKICCLSPLICCNFTTLPTLPSKCLMNFHLHTQQKVTNLELANHWCRLQTSCITAVKWMRNAPNQKVGHWGILKKIFLGHQDIPGKNGTNGNPGNVTSHNSLIALPCFAFLWGKLNSELLQY